ncbi:hypothetical protein HUS70_01360 [Pandoraea nosoerga]|uniref:Uncharacterized protein n=1 Tax=Pandoraea nosoerga TaxID=2508296 RepID=A0A5E4RVD7_9BURK|nr:PhaM family polyhydroxyalkanoate granule multifunctional regulatory protein [Pandoraea nosoerga]MBN4664660.1 hypothetical protein [Pandoraea nosoerga]MBN4674305.1 hypothetical protein [Pandoraea nosoerga]MBN4679574.1 hypothetical protein [Pandoraea nosoerga]MBN4743337.1 hypothetical protein [Pandoraea nosoerga]VVD67025.1 hypothetical protein PNO31109_00397 [Pandoraea nosoerga]
MSDSTSAMPNGFDILKKMWEAFSPPATFTSPLTQLMQSAAPLLDPDEIENRIAEMRAVEQWLTLNLNVLRSTIQAFEVQRATYATLRAFGSGGFDAGSGAGEASTAQASPASEESAGGATFWRSPFAAPEPAQDVEPHAGASEAREASAAGAQPEPGPDQEGAAAGDAPPDSDEKPSPFAQASNAYAALDPSLWFNAMRAQFDQIAAAAQAAGVSAAQMTEAAAAQMSDAAAKAARAAAAPTKSTEKSARKSAAKASGKPAGKGAGKASGEPGKTAKRGAEEATAAGTASKRSPAAKKAPAKSATKASTRASTKASTAAGPAGKPAGKQAAWKW